MALENKHKRFFQMAQLAPHEEAIYFKSKWYQDQMRQKREKLIRQGWITPAVRH